MKILETYKADPKSVVLDKRAKTFKIEEIPEIDDLPAMTHEDSTYCQAVFLRADSVLKDSALPAEVIETAEPPLPTLEAYASTSSNKGIVISQPAMDRMESFISELERHGSIPDLGSDNSSHSMILRGELPGPPNI